MNKKRGRNELCWCNSGKKYKKCHLNRDKEPPFVRSDFEQGIKQISSSKKCSVHHLWPDECSSRIVQAHTISKSGSLKSISENGHVMGTKPSLGQLIKTGGKLLLTNVGISQASTFTGFCAHHDKSLFSPLEDQPISLSDEQLFLLAYRSLAREIYAKEGSIKNANFLKEADRGAGLVDQIFIQSFANSYGHGADLAIADMHNIKHKMDEILLNERFTALNHFVIEFAATPKVLVSASTQPEFDFAGQRLQHFNDQKMSYIIFNAISYGAGGCFVFTWLDEDHAICEHFAQSLAALGPEEIGNALVRFCYSYAENTWAAPSWWASLNNSAKDDISDRLHQGLPGHPQPPSCLVPNGINFHAFKVSSFFFRLSPESLKRAT